MCIRNVVMIFLANLINNTAEHSSKRGMDVVFSGATHDFAHINRVSTSPSTVSLLKYKHAPYAYEDASENPCMRLQPPVFNHLGILIAHISLISCQHFLHFS